MSFHPPHLPPQFQTTKILPKSPKTKPNYLWWNDDFRSHHLLFFQRQRISRHFHRYKIRISTNIHPPFCDKHWLLLPRQILKSKADFRDKTRTHPHRHHRISPTTRQTPKTRTLFTNGLRTQIRRFPFRSQSAPLLSHWIRRHPQTTRAFRRPK